MIDSSLFSNKWKIFKVGEICKSIVPGRNKPEFSEHGYPWLTIDDLENFYLYDSKQGYRVSGVDLNNAGGKIVPANSVVMSCVGQFGIVGIAKTEIVINQQLHAFICPSGLDPYFLATVLIWQKSFMERMATKTTVSYMNKASCESIPIPLPPLPEQRKIAEILSTWDEAITKTERLIAALRERKKGLMQRVLTGQIRFAGFDEEWVSIRLDERVDKFIVPMRDKPPAFGGNIPWCRIEDFDGVYLKESKSGRCVDARTIKQMNLKVYPVGTVLCSCSADLGRCAITATPLVTNQTFIGLVTGKNIDSLFLYYYLTFNDHQLQRISSGTTIAYLSREEFEKFKVRIPPTLEEQIRIAEVLFACDHEIKIVQSYLSKIVQQKKGLMQRLLTGQVRVKV